MSYSIFVWSPEHIELRTLHFILQRKNAAAYSIVHETTRRGRTKQFTIDEEQLIADAIVEFQANGVPLGREFVLDVSAS